MPQAHPAHIVVIGVLVICLAALAAAVALPWTVATATMNLGGPSGQVNIEVDNKMFQTCTITSGGNSQCQSWQDNFDQVETIRGGSGNGICADGTGTKSGILTKVQVAAGCIVCAVIFCLIHIIVVAAYAFGGINFRWCYVISGVLVTLACVGSWTFWNMFNNYCSPDFCTQWVETDQFTSASCGFGAGMPLAIAAYVAKILCYIPLRCYNRPFAGPTPFVGGMPVQAVVVQQPFIPQQQQQQQYYQQQPPQQQYNNVYGYDQQQVQYAPAPQQDVGIKRV